MLNSNAGISASLVKKFASEREQGRLFPAFVCIFAFGVLAYFSLPMEPSLSLVLALCTLGTGVAIFEWWVGKGRTAVVLFFCFVAGMTAAKVRTDGVLAPRISAPMSAKISGLVTHVDRRGSGSRLVIENPDITPLPIEGLPKKIRLSVKGKDSGSIRVGDNIEVRARLFPPSGAIMPGGYDFARRSYFRSIGATGFSFGAPRIIEAEQRHGFFRELAISLANFRRDLTERIAATVPGRSGGIAAALITGERSHVSEEDTEALRDAGLSHVLAISGMHMALFAGTVFFIVRGLAVLIGIGSGSSIKKWAAIAALASATAYLGLSGASIPTQRAYVMTLVVLFGIIAGRPALTMRTVALAALLILSTRPESILEPGFQMSFMAVVALVAVYESIKNRRRSTEERPKVFRNTVLTLPVRFIGALLLTSLVASLATAPFGIYHFHRMAPFGLLGNLLAMPIVSIIVMPSAVVSLFLMPVGLDWVPLTAMGAGIEIMVNVAHQVQSATQDLGVVRKFPSISLVLITGGLLWLCIWQTVIRFAGFAPILVALVLIFFAGQPDIILAEGGKMIAARSASGRMMIATRRKQNFLGENWLSANGISDPLELRRMQAGQWSCDKLGCIVLAYDAAGLRPLKIAQVKSPLAFSDDCARADIIVTALVAPSGCSGHGPMVLDQQFWDRAGSSYLSYRPVGEPSLSLANVNEVLEMRSSYDGAARPWQPGYDLSGQM